MTRFLKTRPPYVLRVVHIWFIVFSFLPASVSAQDFLLDWEFRLLSKDPVYQQAYENYCLDRGSIQSRDDQWLPGTSVDPSYTLSKSEGADGVEYTQSASLAVNLSQKLPWGGSLSGKLLQSATILQSQDNPYGYNSSGSVSLTAPVQFLNQGFGLNPLQAWMKSQEASQKAVVGNWNAQRLRRIAQTLKLFIGTMIDQKVQENRSRLLEWYMLNAQADQSLWAAGRISSFDLTEKSRKQADAQQAYLQGQKLLSNNKSEVQQWGIDPEKEDLEGWLQRWETVPVPSQPAQSWSLEAESHTLLQSAATQWQDEQAFLPQVNISYSFTPALAVVEKADISEAFQSYWWGALPWNWTFSASLRWPLVPWDPLYRVSEKGLRSRRSLEAQERSLAFRHSQWKESQTRSHLLLQKALEQGRDRYLLEMDREELYSLKVQTGQISPQERDYQRIQTETARLDWFRARLELLVSGITGE